MRHLGALAVALFALGACSGPTDPRAAPIVYDEEQAAGYAEAHAVCSSSTPEQLLVERNARSTEPQALSTAYALLYETRLRVPIFQGCLDALEGRPAAY